MKYTVEQIKQTIDALAQLFDLVRLVEPADRHILHFAPDGSITKEPYYCYQVWHKRARCTNCISTRTYQLGRRITKYEFVYDEIYHVTAIPVELFYQDTSVHCVLEIVSNITDEVLLSALGKNEFIDKILASEKRIFEDSLTSAYGRRYFDEHIFCHNDRVDLEGDVVFIMCDLKKFKDINDTYGHELGDWVLAHTVLAMQSCIRREDSIIRMGGDEFLIVLSHSTPEVAARVIAQIRVRMEREVIYDSEHGKFAVVNFGIAHTHDFHDTAACVDALLKEADRNMYTDKKQPV